MREIKFKVFKKSLKKFLDFTITPYNCICNSHNENDLIFIQYTGLKDKNGKEIYEGDIIATDNNYILGEVIFGECVFESYYIVMGWTIKERYDFIFCSEKIDNCNYYVAGNIYDNPELLEEK